MITSLFIVIALLLAICAVFVPADEPTLGCPDPELHDRNNENYNVLVTALSQEGEE